MKKKCPRCNCIKNIDKFHFNKSQKLTHGICKDCKYDVQKTRWKDRKTKAVQLMGGECSICGYCKNYASLIFHHKNPSEKEFDWNKMRLLSWDKVIKELSKCVMLCHNCHYELHNPDLTIGETPKINLKDNALLNQKPLTPTGVCKVCEFSVYGTAYCSVKCSTFDKRKVTRPSKEELAKLIEENSWVAIAKMYGISDNGVRKWAKQYDLI